MLATDEDVLKVSWVERLEKDWWGIGVLAIDKLVGVITEFRSIEPDLSSHLFAISFMFLVHGVTGTLTGDILIFSFPVSEEENDKSLGRSVIFVLSFFSIDTENWEILFLASDDCTTVIFDPVFSNVEDHFLSIVDRFLESSIIFESTCEDIEDLLEGSFEYISLFVSFFVGDDFWLRVVLFVLDTTFTPFLCDATRSVFPSFEHVLVLVWVLVSISGVFNMDVEDVLEVTRLDDVVADLGVAWIKVNDDADEISSRELLLEDTHEYDFEVAECMRLVAPMRVFANESWEECNWCPDDKRESAGFEPCRLPEMSDCRFVNASKDFFLSAMVNDDDRDAGLPKYKCNAIIQLFAMHTTQ